MSDKPGKPRWDVRAHLYDKKYDELYRKINLFATLTWGLKHQQVYVDLTLKGILEEMLFGGTIDDAYDSGFLDCEKPKDNGYNDKHQEKYSRPLYPELCTGYFPPDFIR